jgi:hypothetical protein
VGPRPAGAEAGGHLELAGRQRRGAAAVGAWLPRAWSRPRPGPGETGRIRQRPAAGAGAPRGGGETATGVREPGGRTATVSAAGSREVRW